VEHWERPGDMELPRVLSRMAASLVEAIPDQAAEAGRPTASQLPGLLLVTLNDLGAARRRGIRVLTCITSRATLPE
jgi:hypothetical protein